MKSVALIFFLILTSCTNTEFRTVETNAGRDLEEKKLGQTKYYLNLPNDFILNESHGKEGQINYNINTTDSFPQRMFGSIEIDLGQRISDKDDNWGDLKEKVVSKFMGRNAVWKIYQTETGYYVAITYVKNIYADVSSKDKKAIDTLISVVSTLHKK